MLPGRNQRKEGFGRVGMRRASVPACPSELMLYPLLLSLSDLRCLIAEMFGFFGKIIKFKK